MKKVILSLTLDGPIPAVTKQDIAEQSAEKLKNLDFKYSVQPEKEAIDIHNELVSGVISAVNEEPISATLDTFGDIDKAMEKAHQKLDTINPNTARFDEQRNFSSKDTSSSKYSVYSLESDPLNEE